MQQTIAWVSRRSAISGTPRCSSGEPLEPVRNEVNRILAEDGEPRRFYFIPAPDRHIGFVFIPPDVYAAATARGILPPDPDAPAAKEM